MRPLSFAPIVLPLVAAALGCTGNVAASPEAADAEANAITAVVVVERTSGNAQNQADSARAEAVARFVRMRSGAVDDDALRSVGAAVDFPALGSCARAASGGATPIMHALDLVDVGAISLEADGSGTSLVARRLPDVADLVSGVVYTARAKDADDFTKNGFPARGHYLLRAAGSADIDVAPFVVEASLQGEPADIRVGGQEARAGEKLTVGTLNAVEVTWTAQSALDSDDLVYIDIASSPGTATGVTRCLFSDNGRATLSAQVFGDGEGTLTAHRLHREAFRSHGIDSGEIRFDFARVVAFRTKKM